MIAWRMSRLAWSTDVWLGSLSASRLVRDGGWAVGAMGDGAAIDRRLAIGFIRVERMMIARHVGEGTHVVHSDPMRVRRDRLPDFDILIVEIGEGVARHRRDPC